MGELEYNFLKITKYNPYEGQYTHIHGGGVFL